MSGPVKNLSVAKFGGSSLGDEAAMKRSAEIVLRDPSIRVVVVSATFETTNHLLSIAHRAMTKSHWPQVEEFLTNSLRRHQRMAKHFGANGEFLRKQEKSFLQLQELLQGISLIQDCSAKLMDQILSFGEGLSQDLLALALNSQEDSSTSLAETFDIKEIMRTDGHHGKATPQVLKIRELAQKKLIPLLETHPEKIFITQGFLGCSPQQHVTTLGRGGSDYSASLVAEAIEANEVQIWTDVAGIATIDPKLSTKARPIEEISYREAAELATFGAKVLHPTTLWPAIRQNIPVTIRSSNHPENPGTWIKQEVVWRPLIRAMALKKEQCLLTITTAKMLHTYGFLEKIFQVFSRHQIGVDLVTTSEISVALTLDNATLLNNHLIEDLQTLGEIKIEKGLSMISIIGNQMSQQSGLASKIFSVIAGDNVRLICGGAGQHNLSFLVDENQGVPMIQKLHQELIEKF